MRTQRFFSKRYVGGLTLVEAVIGVALFVGISVGLFSTFMKVSDVMRLSQTKVIAIGLANEQFEVARNLPYSKVGTIGGIPAGLLPQVQTFVRSGQTFIATTTVRNVDQPFDGTAGGAPNDLSPADNKLVEIEVTCITCVTYRPVILSTIVGPRDLESDSTNGSLFVRTFDAGGQPVADADVRIVNTAVSPAININDISNTQGMLQLIDAPPSINSYRVTVSKSGYSTDMTGGAPTTTNPATPHATVAVQTVTQLTFFIDRLATLNVSSVTPTCVVVPNVNVDVRGAKLITDGTPPDVSKYYRWFTTDGSGSASLNDVEWDTYTMTASSGAYDLAGVSTLSPFFVGAGEVKNIQAIMVPKNPKSIMVTVRDAGTLAPLSNATVILSLAGVPTTKTTGRGFLKQTDWSGGGSQDEFIDETRYKMDDTNLDTIGSPGDVRLRDFVGTYPASGMLESSIFDTGSPSTFYQFTYQPVSQAPEVGGAPILFQLSTGNATTSMGPYLGYDGTAGTYYSSTSTDVNAVHTGDRYLSYKMYLTTSSTTFTPNVSDALFTFTSSCIPPGQVIFQGLANNTYDLTVSHAGYTDYAGTVTVDDSTPWQEIQVPLAP